MAPEPYLPPALPQASSETGLKAFLRTMLLKAMQETKKHKTEQAFPQAAQGIVSSIN
jgi:hypothetical protein